MELSVLKKSLFIHMNKLNTSSALLTTLCLLLFASVFTSCKDDDDEILLDINERIVGQWTVSETKALGLTIPGDGSYITFNACSGSTCTGTDFLAEDESTSSLTYEFKSGDTVLSIEDNDSEAGGAYTGDWTIATFTNSELLLTADTFLGEVSIKFNK